jgi:hypothetical protein
MLWRARGAEPGLKWEAWPLSRVEMTRACIGELNNGLTHLIMTKLGTQNEPLRGGIFIADTAGLFCYSCRLCLLGAPGRSCTTTHLEVRPELALYSMVRANCRLLGDSAVTVYTTYLHCAVQVCACWSSSHYLRPQGFHSHVGGKSAQANRARPISAAKGSVEKILESDFGTPGPRKREKPHRRQRAAQTLDRVWLAPG